MHRQRNPHPRHRRTMARQKAEGAPHSESALREVVLRRLAHAPRTRSELARDLRRRGADLETIEAVLDDVEDIGLIDDGQFARLWVESRHRGRGLARSALRRELSERGVDAEIVTEALEAIDGDDERTRAQALVVRRVGLMTHLDSQTRQRRLMGFLMRRGYSAGLAASVVAEVCGSSDDMSTM